MTLACALNLNNDQLTNLITPFPKNGPPINYAYELILYMMRKNSISTPL